MVNPSPDKNQLSLSFATLTEMPKRELDWQVEAIPTLGQIQKFLSDKYDNAAKHLDTITTERYHNYVFDVGQKKIVAKVQWSLEDSYLPEGLLQDHLVVLGANLEQVSSISGIITSKNLHTVGLFKDYVEGSDLLTEIDNDNISRECLQKDLFKLVDSWAAKGFLLHDIKLNNFLRREDGMLHLIDQGALVHKDQAGKITISDVHENLEWTIKRAFELKGQDVKLSELVEPL